MKNTEGDVWEMIWMEKCAAVVVLCKFVEENDVSRQCTYTLKQPKIQAFQTLSLINFIL